MGQMQILNVCSSYNNLSDMSIGYVKLGAFQ